MKLRNREDFLAPELARKLGTDSASVVPVLIEMQSGKTASLDVLLPFGAWPRWSDSIWRPFAICSPRPHRTLFDGFDRLALRGEATIVRQTIWTR